MCHARGRAPAPRPVGVQRRQSARAVRPPARCRRRTADRRRRNPPAARTRAASGSARQCRTGPRATAVRGAGTRAVARALAPTPSVTSCTTTRSAGLRHRARRGTPRDPRWRTRTLAVTTVKAGPLQPAVAGAAISRSAPGQACQRGERPAPAPRRIGAAARRTGRKQHGDHGVLDAEVREQLEGPAERREQRQHGGEAQQAEEPEELRASGDHDHRPRRRSGQRRARKASIAATHSGSSSSGGCPRRATVTRSQVGLLARHAIESGLRQHVGQFAADGERRQRPQRCVDGPEIGRRTGRRCPHGLADAGIHVESAARRRPRYSCDGRTPSSPTPSRPAWPRWYIARICAAASAQLRTGGCRPDVTRDALRARGIHLGADVVQDHAPPARCGAVAAISIDRMPPSEVPSSTTR